jgi:hypothetical protein
MNKLLVSCFIGAGLVLGAAAARADSKIDVGRLTAVFKEAGWTGSADMPFNGELMSAQGTLRGKGKVFSLAAADGKPAAVIYVGVTYGQVNVYTPRGACFQDAQVYVRDLNESRLENYRCVYAGGPFESDKLMGSLLGRLKESYGSVSVPAPDEAFFALIHVSAKGGFVLHIEALMAPGFVGLPDAKPVGDLPANLRPGVAAWTDQFGEAAIKALTSFSGNLVIPPVMFSSTAK